MVCPDAIYDVLCMTSGSVQTQNHLLLACAPPVSQNCFLFVCFGSKNIFFCHYGSLDFLLQFFCLQILWSSVLKRGSLKVVNREGNQMEFSKSKCFAELEVDFLQALCLRTW